MTAHPYRAATLTPPEAPPWWQRVAARVAPGLCGASEWQWYRRRVGGRWCRVRLVSHDVDFLGRHRERVEGAMWARLARCPRPVTVGRRCYSAGLVFDPPVESPIAWAAWDFVPEHAVDAQGRCSCEVWT